MTNEAVTIDPPTTNLIPSVSLPGIPCLCIVRPVTALQFSGPASLLVATYCLSSPPASASACCSRQPSLA